MSTESTRPDVDAKLRVAHRPEQTRETADPLPAHRVVFHPRGRFSSWQEYVTAAIAVAVVAILCFPFRAILGYQTVSLVLLLAVTLLSLRVGSGPILLAAALSAAIWDFFFIPPLFTIDVTHSSDMLMLVTYFIVAIVTGVLSARTRANEAALRLREERASALFAITRDLSQSTTADGVVRAAVQNLRLVFDVDVCVCLSSPEGDLVNTPHPASTFSLDEKEFAVASWAYWNEQKAGRFTQSYSSALGQYFPLSGPRYSLGVIGVKYPPGASIPLEHETLLENFMDQIASALERETLDAIAARAMVVAESERLSKTLLDSVSHELRTPLAAITGNADELMDESTTDASSTRHQLITEIQAAARRMNRLVGNLLDMTRLESGMIKPHLDWCDVRDMLNDAISHARATSRNREINVVIQPETPLVRLDYGLTEQAIANLILNAIVYAPSDMPITVSVTTEGKDCVISVADRGQGLPKGMEEKIFEKFYRIPGTKAGGTGLGLSIVRGFVRAQGGNVTARNLPDGGAEFTIRLPMEGKP